MTHPHIAARLFNTELLIHPGKAAAILSGLGGRITGTEIDFDGATPLAHVAFDGKERLGIIGDRLGRAVERSGRKPYDMIGNVAVIPVEGSLVHKGGWLESNSGETSYQGLQTQVQAAMRDNTVAGVAFEIDSPGGEGAGAFETSDMIAELSRAKPTLAILSDTAFSAGYLMAAAARQIIVPEMGGVGSIGAVTMHTDLSAAAEKAGVKVTIIAAGAHKADGNSFQALSEDVIAEIQSGLEAARQVFATRVSQYRGKQLSYQAAMATEARTYRGAEAVKEGLADATGHPSQAFKAFLQALNRA